VILFLRTLVFYLGLVAIVLILTPGLVVALFLPQLSRNRFFTIWGRTIIWLQKVICGLSFEVIGRENIPQGNGIILCKHQSAWETFTLQLVFPPQTSAGAWPWPDRSPSTAPKAPRPSSR